MKRYPACLLAVLCVLSLLVFPAEAAAPKVIGKVLTTDIRAYINGAEIPAYNIDGNMVIVGSDLRSYGFSVVYNNDTRTSSVTLPASGGTWKPMTDFTRYSTVGKKVMDVYATDIKVLINGREVQAYNVDNRMAFRFSELKVFGNYKYDNATRTTNLKLKNAGSEGLAYQSNGDGTCSVSGIGSCTDRDLIIPAKSPAGDKVTSVGDMAFLECPSLVSVTLPEGVVSVGGTAFAGCTALAKVHLPAGLKTLGQYAFADCAALTAVTLPDSLTAIGPYAFQYCTALTRIVIPAGVSKIDLLTFSGCSSLAEVVLPDSATQIEQGAFTGCSALEAVTIPEGVAAIAPYTFSGCTGLRNVVLPASVKTVSQSAFENCSSLSSVTLPAGMTELGYRAFAECVSLLDIFYSGTEEEWTALNKGENWDIGTPDFTVLCTGSPAELPALDLLAEPVGSY